MKPGDWIETEKEFENSNGEWICKKKRSTRILGLTPRTKENWEIFFKFFTTIAIFIPFLLLIIQNKNEKNRQKRSSLSELSSVVLSDIYTFVNKAHPDSLQGAA